MGEGVTAIKKSKKSISPLIYHVNWCIISFTEVRTQNCFILSPTGYNNWSHTHLLNIGKVSSQLISGSKNIERRVRGRVSTLLQKNLKKNICRVKGVHQVSLIDMEYFKDDQRMPFYLRKHADMKEIFNACTGGVNIQMICEKIPSLSKGKCCLYLQSKYLLYLPPVWPSGWINVGCFKRSDKVRFYECTRIDGGLLLSAEVHVVKEGKNVIGCFVKSEISEKWC